MSRLELSCILSLMLIFKLSPMHAHPQNENSDAETPGDQTSTNDPYDECIATCPVTEEYNPVCGTDNVDYTNPGSLGCAQRCGKEVVLKYYGRCSTGRTG